MSNKVLELIKQKDILIPCILFKNYRKLNITETELVVLICLINNHDNIYNPISLSESIDMPIDLVINTINNLCEKLIIKVQLTKINGLNAEIIDLNLLYSKLTNLIIEKKEINNDIYSYIESKFGRTLSSMEYEIVGTWSNYKEKNVISVIDDTVSKGIVSIKYIDKVLLENSKKGFKEEKKEYKIIDTSLIDYDWLNDN